MVQRKRRDNRYDVLVIAANATKDFFVRPLPSKLVNIFLVKNLNHQHVTPRIVKKSDLCHKVVVLPCDNGTDYLLIPMLHAPEADRHLFKNARNIDFFSTAVETCLLTLLEKEN